MCIYSYATYKYNNSVVVTSVSIFLLQSLDCLGGLAQAHPNVNHAKFPIFVQLLG